MTLKKASILTVIALLFLVTGCVSSVNPISGRKSFGFAWTPSEEIRIGRESDSDIVEQFGLYEDPALSTYVDSLGQALVGVSHFRRAAAEPVWQNMAFHFRILDSPVVNAFALPGGYVYVTRGLLAHTENEAQLAVVLGHEIGHVVGRHGSRAMRKQQFGMGALLLGAIGSQAAFGGRAAANVLDLGSTATQLLFLKYGRDAESESDQLGVEYAAMSGYDASQGAAFFHSLKRMSEQTGQELPSLLSTHPDPGDREAYIRERSKKYLIDYPGNEVGRSSFLRRIDGLVFGEDPRQGFVENSTFYHPDMQFRFRVPEGFRVINQPKSVVMVPESGMAILNLEVDSQHQSARQAADAFKANDSIQIVESGLGQAGGLTAHYVVADFSDNEGRAMRMRTQYIEFSGSVFVFTGLALKENYDTYRISFEETMRGFRKETDPRVLNKQPVRVVLRRPEKRESFRSFISGANLAPAADPLSLAIMNQVELSEIIETGKLYKIIR